MANNQINNVVLYVRVSTQEQVSGFSLEAQETELKKYCKNFSYNIVDTFIDAGISGTSIEERTEFKKMLSLIDAKPHAIDAVLIWKMTRLSRNATDFNNILDFLEKRAIAIISTEDGIDTSKPMGKYMAQISSVFAEMERDNIVTQGKSGMIERARQGKWNGGHILGYDCIDGKLVLNPKECEIIKTIFNLYVHKDYGYNRICKYLNTRGIKTKRNKTWAYTGIKTILDNPTYAGYIRWGVRQDWNNKRRKGTTDNYVLVQGEHESIISEELWQETVTRRKIKKSETPNSRIYEGEFLLTGLIKCPQCGASMVAHRTKRKTKSHPEGKLYTYYICSQYSNKDTSVCKPNLIDCVGTEKLVIRKIREFVKQPNVIELIKKSSNRKEKPKESNLKIDIQTLKKKIKELRTQEDKWYSYLVDKDKLKLLKEEKILERISTINTQTEDIKEEIQALEFQLSSLSEYDNTIEKIKLVLTHFDKMFDIANIDEKKKLIHSLVKEIKIAPSNNFKERVVEKIKLYFNEMDLMRYIEDGKDKKLFVPTCDTVHPAQSETLYRPVLIRSPALIDGGRS